MNKLAISCYLDYHIDFYSTKEGVDQRGGSVCYWYTIMSLDLGTNYTFSFHAIWSMSSGLKSIPYIGFFLIFHE